MRSYKTIARETLVGCRIVCNALIPLAAFVAVVVGGALLLETILWLGILMMAVPLTGLFLVVAWAMGHTEAKL